MNQTSNKVDPCEKENPINQRPHSAPLDNLIAISINKAPKAKNGTAYHGGVKSADNFIPSSYTYQTYTAPGDNHARTYSWEEHSPGIRQVFQVSHPGYTSPGGRNYKIFFYLVTLSDNNHICSLTNRNILLTIRQQAINVSVTMFVIFLKKFYGIWGW